MSSQPKHERVLTVEFEEKEKNSLNPPCRNKPENGRENASLISWISWQFMYDLLSVGKKRPLVEDDIDLLAESDTSRVISNRFDSVFKEEINESNNNPSLAKIVLKTITIKKFVIELILVGTYYVFALINVVSMNKVLNYIENVNKPNRNPSSNVAYMYGSFMVFSSICIAFLHHYLFHETTRNGVTVRTALVSAIYKKSLKISLNSIPLSQIINLMSTDSQRFEELLKYLPFIFAALFVPIIGTFILSNIIDSYLPFLGLLLISSFIPLQLYFSSKFGKLRDQAVVYTDSRLKLINEVLTGVLAMKMYCWEKPLLNAINKSRNLEIKYIKRAATIKGLNATFFFVSHVLIAASIFIPYYYIKGELKSSIIFPTISFFTMMRFLLLLLMPNIIQFSSEVKISMKRLTQFFNAPEMETNNNYQNNNNNSNIPLIDINNCSYSWNEIPMTTLSVVLTSKKKGKINKDMKKISTKYLSKLGDNNENLITLKNINIKISGGNKCIAIIGKIGCGKSSLLNAILSEIPLMKSNKNDNKSYQTIVGNISYASQKAWIFNGSVKDNILFGNEYDEIWFNKVIDCCSLRNDINNMTHKEYTIIGERGVNLSGGQKARVGLARAVYNKSDILLLDDPLSAVDSVVANNIFSNCLDMNNGICKERLIILVTHQTQFLNRVSKIIIMENGSIKHFDTYNNLKEQGIDIKSLIDEYNQNENNNRISLSKLNSNVSNSNENNQIIESNNNISNIELQLMEEIDINEKSKEIVNEDDIKEQSPSISPETQTIIPLTISNTKKTIRNIKDLQNETNKMKKAEKESIIAKEKIRSGGISLRTYKALLDPTIYKKRINKDENISCFTKSILYFKLVYLIIIMISAQVLITISEFYLGSWSQKSQNDNNISHRYVIIYAIIVGASFTVSLIRGTSVFRIIINGAKQLHTSMVHGVLFANMRFYEENPTGRILNRFSKDQYSIDELFPTIFFDGFSQATIVLFAIIVIIFANFYLAIIIIPLIIFFNWVRGIYVANSRVLKRLDGSTRSPIFERFGILLNGLSIVRSFKKENVMFNECLDMIDTNNRMYLTFQQASRWIGCTLDLCTAVLNAATVYTSIITANSASSSRTGVALVYVLFLTGLLQWVVRQFAEIDNHMTSIERIMEYCDLDIEGEKITKKDKNEKLKKYWVKKGEIEFKNVSASYREYLPNVLNNINIKIESGSKIGIVGRTGSGKSTLFLTIFRLLEINSGNIFIDNKNIKNLTLYELRSNISIIPQEVVLFSETIRYNIDPFNEYSNKEIINVLKIVQLYDLIKNLPNGLDTNMISGGSNFSVGESQLFCLARVLLNKNNKILLIDEATSNVDIKTDNLIQNILKNHLYKNKTVLTIAHRLTTILDSDKILVLDNGNIIEYDTPNNLLKKDFKNNKNALFAKMYNEAKLHSKNKI